jgi:hypothetical protein
VQFIRQRLFVPRLKCADLTELNAWLRDRCRALAAENRHPEFPERSVAEVFAEEQERLVRVHTAFGAYKDQPVRVTNTALVSYDTNRYSAEASTVGRLVMLRAYADRIVIVDEGTIVGEHPRLFGRHQVRYDPWHYLSVLRHKPGALRNGAPFRDWELPPPLNAMRRALEGRADGDRQFVGILCAISNYGLETVAEACQQALADGAASRDVVLNILGRTQDDPDLDFDTPSHLPVLKAPPIADCQRYDTLLKGGAYAA